MTPATKCELGFMIFVLETLNSCPFYDFSYDFSFDDFVLTLKYAIKVLLPSHALADYMTVV